MACKVISLIGALLAISSMGLQAQSLSDRPNADAAAVSRLASWDWFTIPKTPDEKAADLRLDGRGEKRAKAVTREFVVVPPRRQALDTAVGIGHVQGADWAADISSVGRTYGVNVDLTGFVTMGRQGLDFRTGRLSLHDAERGWGVEAGHLFTDLRGLARGIRVSRHFSRHQPTLSFYKRDKLNRPTISVRDELRLTSHVAIGGEVASDGSLFARGQTFFKRLGFDTYVRKQLTTVPTTDRGVSAGYDVWKGVTLRGSMRTSTSTVAGADSSDWRLLSLRVPVGRGANVGFEHNWLTTNRSTVSGSAAIVHVPAGRFRIFQRYQWGQTAYKVRERPIGLNQKQMQTMASYQATRWLSLNYQVSTEWFEDGRASQWDELRSALQLGRRTSVEVITAMPKVLEPSRFRFSLSHELQPRVYVRAEYGRISAFRSGPEMATERPRLLISVRKNWNVPTPARGGLLVGAVLEPNGDPVAGAIVRLGDYRDVTDARGLYLFQNLPTGVFEFSLEADTLPANYAYDGRPEMININGSTRAVKNVLVVPLQSITGRVFCDQNRNGKFDEGEQQPAVVIRLNSTVTASDRQGRYGFYNLPSGRYIVQVDGQHLPAGFAATSDSVTVELHADRAATAIDFVLAKIDKPVILKELQ